MMKNWIVYILRCSDGSFYTGITNDVMRRVDEHNQGKQGARYTRGRRPVSLVFQKQCEDRAAAAREEYRLRKLSRSNKLQLIENYLAMRSS